MSATRSISLVEFMTALKGALFESLSTAATSGIIVRVIILWSLTPQHTTPRSSFPPPYNGESYTAATQHQHQQSIFWSILSL